MSDLTQTPPAQPEDSHNLLVIGLIVAAILILCIMLLFVRLIIWRRRVIRSPQLTPEQMEAALAQTDLLHPTPRPDPRISDRDRLAFTNFPQQAPSVVRMQRLLQNSGLSIEEINAVAPTRPYIKSSDDPLRSQQDDSDDTCAVCLDQMEPDSKTRCMPCGHEFHAKCIEDWLIKVNRCPVCNTCIIDEETLQKNRTAVLEGRDIATNPPEAATGTGSRQRRRRTRGQNGNFQLQQTAENTAETA